MFRLLRAGRIVQLSWNLESFGKKMMRETFIEPLLNKHQKPKEGVVLVQGTLKVLSVLFAVVVW